MFASKLFVRGKKKYNDRKIKTFLLFKSNFFSVLCIWKIRQELHKDVACCLEQILEAAPKKKQQLYGHLLPISQTNKKSRARHAREVRAKLRSPIDSYTWVHQCWPTNKNLHTPLCTDTGCRQEDLPRVMTDRSEWCVCVCVCVYVCVWERERQRERDRQRIIMMVIILNIWVCLERHDVKRNILA